MQVDPLSTYGRQSVDEDDIQAVVAALRGQFLTGGPSVQSFETALEKFTGAPHVISCGNCTQALHLAAHAFGVGPGTSVIVPSITFLSTANIPRMLGADVVFSDVDPRNGLMRPSDLEEALRRCPSPPKAVMPVHLAGQVGDIKAIHDVARKNGLKIIEDAAHAIGTTYKIDGTTHRVGDGAFSDATAFSFHPVKNITSGEGGAVLVKDKALAEKIRQLRSHGIVRSPENFKRKDKGFDKDGTANPWYYEMPEFGYNYRLTDIQAALGMSQLAKLPAFIAKRAKLKARYDQLLAPYANNIQPLKTTADCSPAWHLYSVLIDFDTQEKTRAVVMNELSAKGIGTQVHYIPVHEQPYYRAQNPALILPGADEYYARTLSLPLHTQMEEHHVERVVQTLVEVLNVR
jgi:UDP-4-amino-4,6-dideoxy-N-acetyl-beta-L-altrosamine transaminase